MNAIREPAVAGQFYPGSARELTASVEALLGAAPPVADGLPPKALIVPHAGYDYSGAVAAAAYAYLAPHGARYRRVILFGPCHRVPIEGMAMSGAARFRTPAGDVAVDQDAVLNVDLPELRTFDIAHEREHSLEVHLPFLGALLDEFSVVPVVVGNAEPQVVAAALDALWGGPETLIVISSDLSHYLDYDAARRRDAATCRAIERFEADRIGYEDACGAMPLRGLLVTAKRRGMTFRRVDLRNSGDTAGTKERVVGYGSWVCFEPGEHPRERP